MPVLFDTNIFIDMLRGHRQATIELTYYSGAAISAITNMELRVAETPEEKEILDLILNDFVIIPISPEIVDLATDLRRQSIKTPPKMKLGDALIAGTAMHHNLPIITRNERDFKNRGIHVHVPYDLAEIADPADPTKKINVVSKVYPLLQFRRRNLSSLITKPAKILTFDWPTFFK